MRFAVFIMHPPFPDVGKKPLFEHHNRVAVRACILNRTFLTIGIIIVVPCEIAFCTNCANVVSEFFYRERTDVVDVANGNFGLCCKKCILYIFRTFGIECDREKRLDSHTCCVTRCDRVIHRTILKVSNCVLEIVDRLHCDNKLMCSEPVQ